VDLTQEILEGWGVAAGGGITVALDLELTDDLRLEGLAREVIRVVQDARKAAGLDVSDRIALGLEASGALASAIAAFHDFIAMETLAVELTDGAVPDASSTEETTLERERLIVTLAKRERV